ncbi:MAG: GGDEF domain-containing protein [Candidatus Omnitrophica bacterium]|nr:GGDEF domain-containing protein [Candidatus Omnitrophota bacterium]
MELNEFSFSNVLENLNDGVYFTDRNRVIHFWNKGAERISGFSSKEVVGRSCSDDILVHVDEKGNSLCKSMCPLMESIVSGKPLSSEVYMHHRDGHRIPVWVRTDALRDSKGAVTGGVEVFTDISGQMAGRLRIMELERIAMIDNLTNLPNRRFMEQELEKVFEEQRRYGLHFGILFIDIDNFKKFNDAYGHDVGDRVLVFVSKTFASNSRVFDLYGRWGGEEFIGIIRNVELDTLRKQAERMRVLTESSYIPAGKEKLRVTVSIGATIVRSTDTADTLMKRADTLLYQSKKEGKNRVTADYAFNTNELNNLA